jgi:hypothetical protein
MIYWSFVPIIEVAALAVICWKDRECASFSSLIDSFFAGYRPWLVWLAGMSVVWSLMSPSTKTLDWMVSLIWQDAGIVIALVWSLYIDFRFFCLVLKRSPETARRELAMQRLISWGFILPVLGGPTIWQGLTGRLW